MKTVKKMTPQQRALALTRRLKAAEIEGLKLDIDDLNISISALRHKEARALLWQAGCYDITGELTQEANVEHFARLYAWSLGNSGKPLTILLHANDGWIHAAHGLHDVLCELKTEHQVTICVQGEASLMPTFLMQAAHVRKMSPNSILTLSPPLLGNWESDPVASRKRDILINQLYDDLLAILVRRSKQLTPDLLKKKIGNNGWTLSAAEALENGLVDEVG